MAMLAAPAVTVAPQDQSNFSKPHSKEWRLTAGGKSSKVTVDISPASPLPSRGNGNPGKSRRRINKSLSLRLTRKKVRIPRGSQHDSTISTPSIRRPSAGSVGDNGQNKQRSGSVFWGILGKARKRLVRNDEPRRLSDTVLEAMGATNTGSIKTSSIPPANSDVRRVSSVSLQDWTSTKDDAPPPRRQLHTLTSQEVDYTSQRLVPGYDFNEEAPRLQMSGLQPSSSCESVVITVRRESVSSQNRAMVTRTRQRNLSTIIRKAKNRENSLSKEEPSDSPSLLFQEMCREFENLLAPVRGQGSAGSSKFLDREPAKPAKPAKPKRLSTGNGLGTSPRVMWSDMANMSTATLLSVDSPGMSRGQTLYRHSICSSELSPLTALCKPTKPRRSINTDMNHLNSSFTSDTFLDHGKALVVSLSVLPGTTDRNEEPVQPTSTKGEEDRVQLQASEREDRPVLPTTTEREDQPVLPTTTEREEEQVQLQDTERDEQPLVHAPTASREETEAEKSPAVQETVEATDLGPAEPLEAEESPRIRDCVPLLVLAEKTENEMVSSQETLMRSEPTTPAPGDFKMAMLDLLSSECGSAQFLDSSRRSSVDSLGSIKWRDDMDIGSRSRKAPQRSPDVRNFAPKTDSNGLGAGIMGQEHLMRRWSVRRNNLHQQSVTTRIIESYEQRETQITRKSMSMRLK